MESSKFGKECDERIDEIIEREHNNFARLTQGKDREIKSLKTEVTRLQAEIQEENDTLRDLRDMLKVMNGGNNRKTLKRNMRRTKSHRSKSRRSKSRRA